MGGDHTCYFEGKDWLGTERIRTDHAENIVATYTSLAFGDGSTVSSSNPDAEQDTPAYAVLDMDSESSTDHGQFRQYNDTLGNWMSPDPYSGSYDLANPQSMNRYSYVQNNPMAYVDPWGLEIVDCPDGTPEGTICVDVDGGGDDGGGGGGGGVVPSSGRGGGGGRGHGRSGNTVTCQQLAVGQLPSSNFSTWWHGYTNASYMFDNWLTGTGTTDYDFGPNSPESQQMMGAYNLSANVAAFLAGGEPSGFQNFGLSGLLASGLNPTAQFVGSYGWSMNLSDGYLNITITNATTAYSFFYHAPGFNPNPPTYGDSVFNPGRHPMSRINQTFHIRVPC